MIILRLAMDDKLFLRISGKNEFVKDTLEVISAPGKGLELRSEFRLN